MVCVGSPFCFRPHRFDIEPLTLTMKQRTASLTSFLIRLAGIVGGVWVCAGYTLRVGDKAAKTAMKVYKGGDDDEYPEEFTSAYSSSRSRGGRIGGHVAGTSFSQSIYNSPARYSSHAANAGPQSPGGDSTFAGDDSFASAASSRVGDAFAAAKGRAGQAWQAGMSTLGPKHRKTESLQQKMMSEEGRAW